jgi:nucleoside-diphosphate-sugar epimerase
MTTIAVTGASGFIGRHVVAAFRSAGFEVRALTRKAHGEGSVAVDYLDGDALARALEGVGVLVHTAGLAHVSARRLNNPAAEFHRANVSVATSVTSACVRSGVQSMVLLSSAGVLGKESPAGGFDDSSLPAPYDWYTSSKREAEDRVSSLAAASELRVIILRPPAVYGPSAPGSFSRLCSWVARGWPIPVGALANRRSFLGIRNLCDAIRTTANSGLSGVSTMLVADTSAMTTAELAQLIAAAMQRSLHLLSVPPRLLEWGLRTVGLGEEYRRLGNAFELYPSRMGSQLGWRPPYTSSDEVMWALRAR